MTNTHNIAGFVFLAFAVLFIFADIVIDEDVERGKGIITFSTACGTFGMFLVMYANMS